jgi:hypothetical protein
MYLIKIMILARQLYAWWWHLSFSGRWSIVVNSSPPVHVKLHSIVVNSSPPVHARRVYTIAQRWHARTGWIGNVVYRMITAVRWWAGRSVALGHGREVRTWRWIDDDRLAGSDSIGLDVPTSARHWAARARAWLRHGHTAAERTHILVCVLATCTTPFVFKYKMF